MDADSVTALGTAALAVLAFVQLWVFRWVTKEQGSDAREAVNKTINLQREIALKEIHVRFFLHMKERWDSEDLLQKRRALAFHFKQPQPRTDEFFRQMKEDVLNFFEDVSSLLQRGYIEEDLTYEVFSYYATGWYSVCRPYIEWLQAKKRDDSLFAGFKVLVDRMMVREAANRVNTPTLLDDVAVEEFLDEEYGA